MQLLSIIMPVYNSKRFLQSAINSVLHQTYSNFELIIVDDGSTDGSSEICDKYAEQDDRIKVVHKLNGGVCSARNTGLLLANGEYVTFVDNDDEYDINFLYKLYNKAECTNADIVKCGRKNIKIDDDQSILSEKNCNFGECLLSLSEFSNCYLELKNSDILSSVWNGIYRKKIIQDNNILFNEALKHGNEDIIFNCAFFMHCKKIAVIPDVLYTHYYRLSHSTSMHFYVDQIESRIKAINMEIDIAKISTDNIKTDMLRIEGIRECFRILTQSKSKAERKESIKEIENGFDFQILKKIKILGNKNLTVAQKSDLLLLKHKLYRTYFKIRHLRNRLMSLTIGG